MRWPGDCAPKNQDAYCFVRKMSIAMQIFSQRKTAGFANGLCMLMYLQ